MTTVAQDDQATVQFSLIETLADVMRFSSKEVSRFSWINYDDRSFDPYKNLAKRYYVIYSAWFRFS